MMMKMVRENCFVKKWLVFGQIAVTFLEARPKLFVTQVDNDLLIFVVLMLLIDVVKYLIENVIRNESIGLRSYTKFEITHEKGYVRQYITQRGKAEWYE